MLSIKLKSAQHLDGMKHKEISLAIRKEDVNLFLGELWDEFQSSIGSMACFHSYLKTDNPEVYEYNVHWAHQENDFEAQIIFSNHTSKGLTAASAVVVDLETKKPRSDLQDKIAAAIIKINSIFSTENSKATVNYISVPIKTNNKLSGNYQLRAANIILLSNEGEKDRIVFPVLSRNEADRVAEAESKAVDLLSILSTITQQLFDVDYGDKWLLIAECDFSKIIESLAFDGEYVTDHGFERTSYAKGEVIYMGARGDEILEGEDSLIENKQCLPRRADELVKVASENVKYTQSCRRFWEGMHIRSGLHFSATRIYTISYEIIAFIASIEALIDTDKIITGVACENCGTEIYKEEWVISKKFKAFISDLSGLAPALPEVFSKIYEDRSKFVHTGINLHNFGAYRRGRPSILKGKMMESPLPSYYYNIHEFTGYIIRRFLYRNLSTS